MSGPICQWVNRHSPYEGKQRDLHMALALCVRVDEAGTEMPVSISLESLSVQARCTRTWASLWMNRQAIPDGYVRRVPGRPGTYEVLRPAGALDCLAAEKARRAEARQRRRDKVSAVKSVNAATVPPRLLTKRGRVNGVNGPALRELTPVREEVIEEPQKAEPPVPASEEEVPQPTETEVSLPGMESLGRQPRTPQVTTKTRGRDPVTLAEATELCEYLDRRRAELPRVRRREIDPKDVSAAYLLLTQGGKGWRDKSPVSLATAKRAVDGMVDLLPDNPSGNFKGWARLAKGVGFLHRNWDAIADALYAVDRGGSAARAQSGQEPEPTWCRVLPPLPDEFLEAEARREAEQQRRMLVSR